MSRYTKTKESLIDKIYSHQKSSSKKRGHQLPTYTKQELKEWLFAQPKFHLLYDNWKRLDFQKDYVPSIDRKDDNVGYTMANIQLMTWKENRLKFQKSQANKNQNLNKQVVSTDKNGKTTNYNSVKEASKTTGVDNGDISRVCKGKRKSAGGYDWKYLNNGDIK